MKKSMCITYEVDGALYVNITNRCSNRCSFCIRNNGDGAYGSVSLWLVREPTLSEICESVLSHDLSQYSELVFCGYGEPSYRLDDAVKVAALVKEKYPSTKVRINTNGQSDLILARDTAKDYSVFDTVSVSLNSPSAEGYAEICKPHFGTLAFSAILTFAKSVKRYVPDTRFSVVGEYLTAEEISECKRISEECGVPLRVREYIAPEEKTADKA
jgi:TatD family-associated radical SAM protein